MSDVEDRDSLDLPFRNIQHLSLQDLTQPHRIRPLSSTSQEKGDAAALESKGNDSHPASPHPFRQSFNRSMNSTTPVGTTSELATKRRIEKETSLQFETMKQQLETIENKNLELIKSKKKLMTENETKTREIKFLEKQLYEQQNEIQHLRQQLDSTVRITQKTHPSNPTTTGTNSTRNQAQQIPKLAEELKSTQDTLVTKQKEISFLQQTNQELIMKIKILQDALTFRSEEIGLSGHADLLAKVAQLKGEVVALKKELTSKVSLVETMKEDKQQLIQTQSTLQEQISTIQERLAKSQQDAYRYTNNDIGLLLKTTEQERDLLLEYIQQDMNKNISLTKQIESLESELRIVSQKQSLTERALHEAQQLLQHTQETSHQQEEEYASLKESNKELVTQHEQLLYDYENSQKQLQRKQLEEEENTKIQATIFTQLRAKDEELLRKSEETIHLRTKLQEYEHATPSLLSENQQLRAKLQQVEQELSAARQRVHEIEPKLQSLEPFCQQLTKELSENEQKRKQLEQENYSFKHSYDLIQALEQDLQDIDENKGNSVLHRNGPNEKSEGGGNARKLHSPVHFEFHGGTTPTKRKDQEPEAIDQDYLTHSQKHSVWIGLPSIRNLHPKLYEKIRLLSQDLYRKEVDYQQLLIQSTNLQQDYQQLQQDTNEQIHSLTKQQHHHQEKLQQYYQQILDYERKLLHSQDISHLLQQIKNILKSYPSPKLVVGTTGPSSSSSGNRKEEFSKTMATSFACSLKAAAQPSVDDGDREEHEGNDQLDIKDHQLPEYLQQLLLQYTQIAYAYHETMESIEIVTKENEELKKQSTSLQITKDLLEKDYQEIKQYSTTKENQYSLHEQQYYQSVEQATELTEKQNQLILSLQAKVDTLYRDRQIQKAQIHALQQREDTLKHRLLHQLEQEYSFLYQEILTIYPTFSSNTISLQDFLQIVLERINSYLTEKNTSIVSNHHGMTSQVPWNSQLEYPTQQPQGIKRSTSPPPPLPYSGHLQSQGFPLKSSRSTTVPSLRADLNEGVRDNVPSSSAHNPHSSSLGGLNRSTSSTAAQFPARAAKNIDSRNSSAAVSSNVASQLLQERLKKAQQAFAAMKDSLA